VVTEQAVLDVWPGVEADFEAAFAEATKIISSMKGFLLLGLHRCIERGSRYLPLATTPATPPR